MKVHYLLLMIWFFVVLFWVLNSFIAKNQKYENEYRQGKRPKW